MLKNTVGVTEDSFDASRLPGHLEDRGDFPQTRVEIRVANCGPEDGEVAGGCNTRRIVNGSWTVFIVATGVEKQMSDFDTRHCRQLGNKRQFMRDVSSVKSWLVGLIATLLKARQYAAARL